MPCRRQERSAQKKKYWDLTGHTLDLRTEKEYEEQLLDLLRDSVQCHLLSDVPLGAFLSGGVDSGTVVALMSERLKDPVFTCSIGFDEQEYNELPEALSVARLFKTAGSQAASGYSRAALRFLSS